MKYLQSPGIPGQTGSPRGGLVLSRGLFHDTLRGNKFTSGSFGFLREAVGARLKRIVSKNSCRPGFLNWNKIYTGGDCRLFYDKIYISRIGIVISNDYCAIMTEKDYIRLKRRFFRYVEGYRMEAPDNQLNIDLKRVHTLKVCRDMGYITRGEGIGPQDAILARTAALLHDVGRFPQYVRFKTFNDRVSVNHGQMGADFLRKSVFLEGIGRDEQSLLLNTVRYHNAFAVPRLDKRTVLFIKLVRDADKIDIWRVFIEYFGQEKENRSTAAGLGLPEGEGIAGGALRNIFQNRLIPINDVADLNCYKLMLLSWVFGINFRSSFRIIRGRRLIERVAAFLPQAKEVREAVLHVREFIAARSA